MTDDPTQAIETPIETASAAPIEPPIAEDAAPPVVPPVPLAPVAAPSGGSRTRWAVAIGVAGLAIAATIGAVVLFGQQAAPSALSYIPSDAAVVAELRLDLPGDQMQNLGTLLAHFPGFADQSTLTAKLDEALEKLVQSGGASGVNYQADVKPWLAGPAFLGVLNLKMETTATTPSDVVIAATTSGTASCPNLFKKDIPTHETYKGLDLVVSTDGSMACVLDGRQALLGSSANVKKALDAKAAGTSMDKSANYKAARTALGGDRLATVYFDGAALKKAISTTGQFATPGMANLLGQVPPWLMGGVRAEADSFVLDYLAAPAPAASGGPSFVAIPAAHASVIAPMVPGDTLVFIEAQGAGASLQNLLTQLHEIPELAQSLQALDGLGGGGELVGWIDDVGVAVSLHGTTPDIAAILVAKDEASVTSRVASLKTLLTLAGSGNGIEVKSSTIAGVDVTTVTITDLGALLPPGSIPGVGGTPTGPISFSIAAHGKNLLVTSGEGAMTALLNTAAGSSLADNAAFKHAGTRGIGTAQTTVYVGVGATIDLAKGFLNADQLASFQKDAAPYLEPFEGFLLQAATDASGARSRMVITVSQP